ELLARGAPGALADHEVDALEDRGRAGAADEELADAGHRRTRHRAESRGVDGHVAPAENFLSVVDDRALEDGLLAAPARRVLREEAHRHSVVARRRQRERDDGVKELVRELK